MHDRLPAIERDLQQRVESELSQRGFDRRFDGLTVAIEGRDVRVAGAALTELDRRAALAAIRRVEGVRRLIDETTLVPEARPFVLRIAHDGQRRVVLSGAMPDADRHDRLRAALSAAFHGDVVDQTLIRRGVPAGDWLGAAALAAELAASLREGEAVLADRTLQLQGLAGDDRALDAIEDAVRRRLPPGFSGAATLETPLDRTARGEPPGAAIGDPGTCTSVFADIAKARALAFEPGLATLTQGNRRTLSRIAALAARCAAFVLEIRAIVVAGAAETAAADQRLAESRALALLRYLAGAGVARNRLAAKGAVEPDADPGERVEIVARLEPIRGGTLVGPERELPGVVAGVPRSGER